MKAIATLIGVALLAGAMPASAWTCQQMRKPGCCSHHNGVCGCNSATGMQRCCDGATSPSCRCGE